MANVPTRPTSRPAWRFGGCLAILFIATSGCQSGGIGPIARWRMAKDSTLAKGPTAKEMGDTRGMMARWLSPKAGPSPQPNDGSTLIMGSDGWAPPREVKNPEADAELEAAQKLYQQGKLVEAESEFKRIAKERKGTRWGEAAMYHLAESQFQRAKYVAANETYEKLIGEYPATRYLEKAVLREYTIAQGWLTATDPESDPKLKAPFSHRFDGKLPLLGPTDYALQALEHVRHHDPTGPLADDAVLRIADYHYENDNFEDASFYYDQLVTDHPKSPFLERALHSSIEAKVKSYLGPDYDGAGLEQAKEQIKQYMTLFPMQDPETSESLYKTLDLIADQDAERTFRQAEHYLWTGHVASAEYYFGEVPVKWPNSEWAKKAKEQLAVIQTMPRKKTLPSRIMTLPGSTDPLTGQMNTGAVGGNGMSGSPGSLMGPSGGMANP